MFETSRPQKSPHGRRLFYELFPLSIALHGILVGAVILAAVWNVQFPNQSPKYYLAFRLEDAPPPPPPPPPPPAARPQTAIPRQPVKTSDEIVAPTVIPDTTPVLEEEPPPIETPGAVEGGVEGGIEGGEIGGVVGGVEGSIVMPTPVVAPPDGRVHIDRDQPLRMKILSQAYPIYPNDAVSRGWEDSLVVRYVIGKDGRIKEVTIVNSPQRKVFEQVTIRAIRLWRFRPLIQNGENVEVVHELTVNYKLMHEGG